VTGSRICEVYAYDAIVREKITAMEAKHSVSNERHQLTRCPEFSPRLHGLRPRHARMAPPFRQISSPRSSCS